MDNHSAFLHGKHPISRRTMLCLGAAAAAGSLHNSPFAFAEQRPQEGLQKADPSTNETIALTGSNLQVIFERRGLQLHLQQIQRDGQPPMLYKDRLLKEAGADLVGNPFALVVLVGPHRGTYAMGAFDITLLEHSASRLLAYFQHRTIPMQVGMEVGIEGDVVSWRGQVVWNGPDDTDIDFYFPLFSRIRFDSPQRDRLVVGELSGAEKGPLGTVNYSATYLGGLSTPTFLVEGANHGLAFVEDSRADLAADPGACRQRSCIVGTHFPLPDDGDAAHDILPGDQGPFVGWRNRRLLLGAKRFGGQSEYDHAESHGPLPLTKLGDSVDLGPVYSYAYVGSWKTGATWLREKRQHVPLRTSPALWYRDATFLAEDFGDHMVRVGQSFYDLPVLLEEKRTFGSDMLSLPGYSEPEILGTSENMLNRGDYFYPAENLGGWDEMRRGVEATHRQGGHVLLYVEGLIVWKRSRIGRSKAQDWALMNSDASYTENYNGFFDMCPAEAGWQDWFARTLADVVRTTGVDGFFMDSMLATDNHRCFNPKHAHAPQPDIWNWGLRRVLQRVREEVDKVNPSTILLCEGVGDIAREFIDGSLSHGHAWSRMTFTVPLLRFLHPKMYAFEAWGVHPIANDAPHWPVAKPLLWNAVQGYRIFAEQESHELLSPLGRRVREYYDLYPEICDSPVSSVDIQCGGFMTQMFDSLPRVMTIGNSSDQPAQAIIQFPPGIESGLLFDRRDQLRLSVTANIAKISMAPWEYRAFELRA